MGLTQLIEIEMRRGEAGLYSPVGHAGAAAGKDRSDGPSHIAFWLRPVSLFGRFGVTSPASLHVRSAFHVSPGRAPPRGWQSCRRCPRSFTPWVTPQHVRAGAPKHHRVRPGCPDRHSNLDPCNIPHSGVLEKRRMFLVALLSLRQDALSGHSFSALDWRSESRRMRPFLANCPNHQEPSIALLRAVFRLSRPTFSEATEPRPFWYGCRKFDNSMGSRTPEGVRF
jgi:hypothetical protein